MTFCLNISGYLLGLWDEGMILVRESGAGVARDRGCGQEDVWIISKLYVD